MNTFFFQLYSQSSEPWNNWQFIHINSLNFLHVHWSFLRSKISIRIFYTKNKQTKKICRGSKKRSAQITQRTSKKATARNVTNFVRNKTMMIEFHSFWILNGERKSRAKIDSFATLADFELFPPVLPSNIIFIRIIKQTTIYFFKSYR